MNLLTFIWFNAYTRLNMPVSNSGTYHYNQFQSGPTVKQATPAVFLKHYT